jgi:sugar/nucleoside kinase (ribokinase family)
VLYDVREDRFTEWQPRASRVVDPTGAGDAFAGGFLAGRLRGETIERALARGVVAASFALEDWGATRMLQATADEAAARLSEWFGA